MHLHTPRLFMFFCCLMALLFALTLITAELYEKGRSQVLLFMMSFFVSSYALALALVEAHCKPELKSTGIGICNMMALMGAIFLQPLTGGHVDAFQDHSFAGGRKLSLWRDGVARCHSLGLACSIGFVAYEANRSRISPLLYTRLFLLEVARQHRPIVRVGLGSANGVIDKVFVWPKGAASFGNKVMPCPIATVWRKVSKLVP